MDTETLETLRPQARRVAANAYVPASGFTVGAALRAVDGRVFCGCNIENASYGLTVCAERTALFAAVAAGVRAFDALVLYTPGPQPSTPCGACRQVLAEFAPELPIALTADGAAVRHTNLRDLLPDAFRFDYPTA